MFYLGKSCEGEIRVESFASREVWEKAGIESCEIEKSQQGSELLRCIKSMILMVKFRQKHEKKRCCYDSYGAESKSKDV